jgi:membrane protein implicated in regulation of membrane protease activity
MCHLILMLPLLALYSFWIWPIWIDGLFYVVVALASGFMYLFLMRAMRQPVLTGVEGLLQSTGKVIDPTNGIFLVQLHSEIWNARSPDKLHTGDTVQIVGLDGLSLDVRMFPEVSR